MPDGGRLMWATHTAGVLTVDQERVKSAGQARTALGPTLANQVVEGRSPEDLVMEEYRLATREHRMARCAAGHGTDPSTADAAQPDIRLSRQPRLGSM